MMRRRLDLYAECNVEPRAPLDLFTAECCALCMNPECTRSNYGNTKFEARVSNWYERLFARVPRMAADDERFGRIAGQRFLLIDPGGTSTPSQGWVDPRNLSTTTVQVPVRVESAPVANLDSTDLIKDPVPEEPAFEPVAATTHEMKAPTEALAFVNTPVTQGQMIGGKPVPVAPEWRPPTPATPSVDKVVKTGAKIRIGS